MVRELAVEVYLFIFSILFSIFKILPLQNKLTFVVSFKENNLAIYEEMQRANFSSKIVFLCTKRSYPSVKGKVDGSVYVFETLNVWHMILSIYHLATSRNVIVDNYYGFLAAIRFKKAVECIQIWHAAGAIKTFGMKDNSIQFRSERANRRFAKVYSQFHKVVVGSDRFGDIFQEAFQLPAENILPIGIPRTDFFFDKTKQVEIMDTFYKNYPQLRDKKIVLYAPTYREDGMNQNLAINIEEMYENLKEDHVLMIRLHPSVQMDLDMSKYQDFVYDFSKYPSINELLLVVDYLVTDYSSIPFEFSLLEKPMIFFPYDLDQYNEGRGLWESYEKMVPGPIVQTTKEIAATIKNNAFDMEKVKEFRVKWNQYSNGHSSQNLVQYLSVANNAQRKTEVPVGQNISM
ncbi:CDP-glycerol glycerophosphotransferase family protein [Caldibacillus lycopersici]|uniref:CDP-glycerol glycerophosphotransferase family protein n=2 Tax=Perspicuibacillus lycopersici TaxID=1325689 RepID=A0AAE3IRA8_9BACI|nr:CDP-glycerol glycerophosphotransferase family protein [Perspicuibacillus lycopersici]